MRELTLQEKKAALPDESRGAPRVSTREPYRVQCRFLKMPGPGWMCDWYAYKSYSTLQRAEQGLAALTKSKRSWSFIEYRLDPDNSE